MEQTGLGLLAAALGIAGLALLWQTVRASRARGAIRAAYFDKVSALFADTRTGRAGTGFPRLNGRYRGATFDLQALPDTLTFRKLPALWVMVTLPAPLPLRATLDVMVRATGLEPFSNFHSLEDQVAPPPGFPEDCKLRSDDATQLPPSGLLERHATLFHDPRVKELVLSPRGLRITFLAEEANRGRYLLFRDAELGTLPLPQTRLLPHLDRLLALRDDVLELTAPAERISA